jgi:hypothetical protein
MALAPGMLDPVSTCELALELHMPVGELGHRMSAHELAVVWPAFFRVREEARERDERMNKLKGGR